MKTRKVSAIRGIGGKILIIFFVVTVVAIGALALVSLNSASESLRKQAFNQLLAVKEIKRSQIESFFSERLGDIRVLADNPFTVQAAKDLGAAFDEGGSVEGGAFRGHNNEKYDAPEGYRIVHDTYFPVFKYYIEQYGYYDLFIMHPDDGDTYFTVAKESDFGIRASEIKSSLADVWRIVYQEGRAALSDTRPYAPSNDAPAQFIAAPIREKGEIIGIVALQISLDAINGIMQERSGMGKTGETYLVGQDKKMRSDSYLDPEGHSVAASVVGTVDKNGVDTEGVREAQAGRAGQKVIIDYNGNPVLSAWDTIDLGDFKWTVLAEIDEAEIDEPINALVTFILYIAFGIIVVVIVVALVFSRSISKPLGAVTDLSQKIAEGDLTVEKLERKSRDEIGMLAESFGVMLDSLNEVLGQINTSVEQVSSGSDQVAQSSQSLSQGATEQASSLEEVTSSLNEISSQSKQNAESATEANSIAKTAVENAESGNEQMSELVGAMEKINESSAEIKKVVKVIDDIAFQINLLALNANVEAARAGKYGKGFAVVAEEVRNLAVRSAEAVKETTRMVEESTKSIELGRGAAEKTAKQLEEIVSGSSKVADFLGEIALASKEQAQGVEQINSGLEQIDQVTQSNTASAEESASAAEELSSQAQQLKALVARFKLAEDGRSGGNGGRQYTAQAEPERRELGRVGAVDRTGKDNGDSAEKEVALAATARKGQAGQSLDPKEVIKLDDDDFGKF